MSARRTLAGAVSRRSREAKVEWLRNRIEPGASVLLVGASVSECGGVRTDNVVERGVATFADVHALVYGRGDPGLGCPFSAGDACRLPFQDDSFDYVVSNAVIEHVGGPERARLMLSESRRVARRGAFHTTPDRWFPVETHTQVPLIHWLPRQWQRQAFTRAGKPFWNTDYYWLYGRRSLSLLDPSFTVHRMNRLTLVTTWSAD